MINITAEVITIGDELLYGQVLDTNSGWIGNEMAKIGIRVMHNVTVSDTQQHIINAIDIALQRANIVLITGGLGPTKDDLTKDCLARYFNCGFKQDQDALNDITELCKKRGVPVNELNWQQSFIPEISTAIRNPIGTAPGMWFEFENRILVSMPGVPFEMKKMMFETVIPRLEHQLELPPIKHEVVHTIGIAESALAQKLEDWENNLHETIKLAYLPGKGIVKLRLTGIDDGTGKLEDVMKQELNRLKNLIPEFIFGYGDTTLEKEIANLLRARELSISTAESCTGGYVAHRLTTVIGATSYFKGGIVSYLEEVKKKQVGVKAATLKKHGAVSKQTAIEMANGVRIKLGSDIGLSTTGIAGPGGGEPEKPIGTIWIAVATEKETFTKKLQLSHDRKLNIEYTAVYLFNLLRQTLQQKD